MIIVLAPHYATGGRFLAAVGLRGTVIATASRLQGIRPSVIIELPGYDRRPDRFAIESRLRYIKPEPVRMLIERDEYDEVMSPVPALPEPHQTTIDDQIAVAETDRLRRISAIELAAVKPRTAVATSTEQAAADAGTRPPEPAFKPRSRAKKQS